ncbi:hypothetical protein [Pseudomonas sp. NPDC090592]|uniref:hypothetical protein n=1 Tax=Pseudomonas sp. NPDC090592 TaxID=3364480 RepID=UPI00383B2C7F
MFMFDLVHVEGMLQRLARPAEELGSGMAARLRSAVRVRIVPWPQAPVAAGLLLRPEACVKAAGCQQLGMVAALDDGLLVQYQDLLHLGEAAKQATRWMARALPVFAGKPAPTVVGATVLLNF